MASSQLKILNWNANGILCRNRALELLQLLEEEGIGVACITETHLKPTQNLFIPNFVIHRKDRIHSGGGGVLILVHRTYRHKAISTSSNCETIGVEISLERGPLRIISCYNPPQISNNFSDLVALLNSNFSTIIAGDLNAKHPAWGCSSTNSNGRSLLKKSLRHHFSVEIPPSTTHVPGSALHSPEILDIFITKNINIHSDPQAISALSSDHSPVILALQASPLASSSGNTNHIDWLHLKFNLETSAFRCSPITSTAGIDTELRSLIEDIDQATSKATTSRPPQAPHTKLPEDILKLIKQKNKIRKLWQTQRAQQLKTKLNSLQKTIHSKLVEFRSRRFNEFISEAESHPKSVWKVISSIRNRRACLPPLQHNGQSFSLDEEKAEIFASSLSEQCSPLPSPPELLAFHEQVSLTVHQFLPINRDFPHTSPSEIKSIIRKLKNKKSPGMDGLRNNTLKILPHKHIMAICNIINAIMRHQYFPPAWKEAIVVCIPKVGKPLSAPSSYRPISLLNSLSKVAESVILQRLSTIIKNKNLIPDCQHGFRTGHSTCHQLLRVTELIADNMNRRRHTSMLLLDIQQAFDRVWHEGLIYKLIANNIPHYLIGTIKSYLSDRIIRVRVGNTLSSPKAISAGVPQGSKLSPLLFTLFCHDLPIQAPITTALYADDIALIDSTGTICHSTSRLNRFLPLLLRWYSTWKLSINKEKSTAIFISRRNRTPPNIVINGTSIPWCSSVKYLGVTIDRKLTWNKHLRLTRGKMIGAFVKLKPFFQNQNLSPGIKVRAFNAIIKSIATYAIPIWGSTPSNRLDKLQGTFMRLLRSSLKIPWFIRNAQVLRETNLLTLRQYASLFAENLRNSTRQHSNPGIRSLSRLQPKSTDRYRRPCHLINNS